MRIIRGHYDGKRIELDEPVPDGVQPLTPVRIVFENLGDKDLIDELAQLAGDDELPADYSEQHDHYVKGTPRK